MDWVLVDKREPDWVVRGLVKRGLRVKKAILEVADVVYNDLAIERKSASDFVNSLVSKRLWAQLENLKQYPKPCLVIVGSLKETLAFTNNPSNLYKACLGTLSSIIVKFGIPVVVVETEESFLDLVTFMVKSVDKKGSKPVRVTKRKRTLEEEKEDLLVAIEGVGRTLAKRLLENFKTIKNIVEAEPIQIAKVKGISLSLAKHIWEVLNR